MISAVVLAAGYSRRMGFPKLTLPWGDRTVIGQVVSSLAAAGVEDIVVVTGSFRSEVEAALAGLPARPVFNPRHAEDQMLLSLQTGLHSLGGQVEASFVALGDQPQVEAPILRELLEAYLASKPALVVPSFEMRRGHPWILDRSLWPEVLSLDPPFTLRDLLNRFSDRIQYLVVDSDSILQDLDTPHDYRRLRPTS